MLVPPCFPSQFGVTESAGALSRTVSGIRESLKNRLGDAPGKTSSIHQPGSSCTFSLDLGSAQQALSSADGCVTQKNVLQGLAQDM